MSTLLPGHVVDEPAKGNPRLYFFVSGTENGQSGFTILEQPSTGIIDALRYTADKSRLWEFSHTPGYELKAKSQEVWDRTLYLLIVSVFLVSFLWPIYMTTKGLYLRHTVCDCA